MKILTVVGARPQFIKAAALSRELRRAHREILVHTGQHYSGNMSDIFFKELDLPAPDYNLGVGSGGHGVQTGRMLARIETVLLKERPDCVLVYGDTNSTLAGALAAVKLHIPVVHVEAGLRSFNRGMPEEINRILTDQASTLLFCPSRTAAANLRKEGIVAGVHIVGDIMQDALLFAARKAARRSAVLQKLGLEPGGYLLATVHRAENTDDPVRLRRILSALRTLAKGEPVIFPVHPRTKKQMRALGAGHGRVRMIAPVGYLDMIMLERSARLILTDSGGVQKEAYWLEVPCLTLRDETEWVETVPSGWNRLVGANEQDIVRAARAARRPAAHPHLYGDGRSARRCASLLRLGPPRFNRVSR
ncbi:MAG: non-hydrolyzing UDP-N-acetylglucosamine 2-epimerase [Elusimicrobiota bacterium]